MRIVERLSEQPYQTESSQIFRLSGFTVIARRFPPYSYGDILVVEGVLQRRDGKHVTRLLKRQSSNFVLIYPEVSLNKGEHGRVSTQGSLGLVLMRNIVNLRLELVDLYEGFLQEPHASLASGIILGVRRRMPGGFYTTLTETGTLHVIAASGMNVTIISGVMMSALMRVFTRRKAIILAIFGVIFYAILAGASAPVVRAVIMGTLTFVAAFLGREKDGGIALMVTAIAMLVWNPLSLVDVGWQLSFTATAGILYVFPLLKRYIDIYFESFPLALGDELAVTLAAQLATLPLLVYHFGRLSWISPVVNVLVAPVVPVIMVWGGAVGLVGLVWSGLGRILAWGLWVFLEYFVRVVEVFGSRFGSIELGEPSFIWVMGYYLIFSWLIWRLKKRIDYS